MKKVVITGTSSGIGSATGELFKELGWAVYGINLNGRAEQFLEDNLIIDLSTIEWDADEIGTYFKKIGCLDGLVNNAGVGISCSPLNYLEADWNKTISLNLRAPFILSKLFVPHANKNGASIVNITSLASNLGLPENPAYHAAKGGLSALTRSLAKDLSTFNIRVNSLAPGYISTKLNERSLADPELRTARARGSMMGRWGDPIEVARCIAFLIDTESSFINGSELMVDGGWRTNSHI